MCWVGRKGFLDKAVSKQRPQGSMQTDVGRTFQAQGTAGLESFRQERARLGGQG